MAPHRLCRCALDPGPRRSQRDPRDFYHSLLTISLTAIMGLVLCSPLLAQLDPFDVARLQDVGEVAISPDGSLIAYTVSVPRNLKKQEDGAAWSELHVAPWGGDGRPFIVGEVRIHDIAWLPDGSGITYLAKRDAAKDEEEEELTALYMLPIAGGESRRLVALETDIRDYSLAPHGERVALLANEPQGDWEEAAEKKGFTQVIYAEEEPNVRVWIASVDRRWGNVAADNAKEDPSEQGEGEPRMLDLDGSASVLHWSPAGDRLAVALAPTPLVDDHYVARQIHIVDVESGEAIGIVAPRGKLGQVQWSPDGSMLAAISAVDRHDPRPGRLMVVGADGGELRDLTPELKGHVQEFAWLDSGRLLAVIAEGAETPVYVIAAKSSERTLLLDAGEQIWDDVSVAEEGNHVALTGSSAKHPEEVYAWNLGDTPPQRVTHSNPWLAGRRLGRQEVVTWEARDVLRLQGVLIYPLDYTEGEQAPLVLAVHGGPESHVSDGWLTSYAAPGQVAATVGMAVLYPNYRGSTGRGLEFSKLSQGDPAGAEFDDLVDAVDHFIATGLADPDAIGITGGSYGGYATAWGATRYTERFDAGVMFVGIADQMFSTLQGDIPHEHHLVHIMRWPWESWTELLKASPIYYTDDTQTPLLILGGTADTRVNPAQSLALYNALKIRSSVPVRYVRYPDEPHGNRRAAARLDYNLRMIRWLENFLIEGGTQMPPYRVDYGEIVDLESEESPEDAETPSD